MDNKANIDDAYFVPHDAVQSRFGLIMNKTSPNPYASRRLNIGGEFSPEKEKILSCLSTDSNQSRGLSRTRDDNTIHPVHQPQTGVLVHRLVSPPVKEVKPGTNPVPESTGKHNTYPP